MCVMLRDYMMMAGDTGGASGNNNPYGNPLGVHAPRKSVHGGSVICIMQVERRKLVVQLKCCVRRKKAAQHWAVQ